MRADEFTVNERINPTGTLANFLRTFSNAISTYIPAGLAVVGTYAATTAFLGPIVAAMAGTTAGQAVLTQITNNKDKAPGLIKQLIDKYVGSEQDVAIFSLNHAKAAYQGQPEFRWGGSTWPTTLDRNSAEAIIERQDPTWLDTINQQ